MESDPYLWLTDLDADPGGLKIYGSTVGESNKRRSLSTIRNS
jgi:hypothetical protein